MKEYVCYYSCPFCPNPCCPDWEGEANEMVEAENKTEARRFFNRAKQCRYMKITRIEEYVDGISNVRAVIDGKEIPFKTLGEAIDASFAAWWAKQDKLVEGRSNEKVQ